MRCPLLQFRGAYFNNDGLYSELTNCVMKNIMIIACTYKITPLYGENILYSFSSTSTPVLCYGLFRQVNCFRSSCFARQERNHSEKVSEREWRRVWISRSRCFSDRNFPRLSRGRNRCSRTLQRIFRRLL